MKEVWRKIEKYPGYEVSDRGRVRSLDRTGGLGRVYRGKLLTQHPTGNGYMKVSMCVAGLVSQPMVHQLVLEAFEGPCPSGMEARHLHRNKKNNKHGNLKWGTPQENAADKKRHGTASIGDKHGRAKLTTRLVKFIRKSKLQGVVLARRLNVCPDTIGLIRRRKIWRHV
jgi:hypothetical protein